MTASTLVDRYFDAWATTDTAHRHELVTSIFAENATHHAAPANVTFTGREEIEANITRVNNENLVKAGLSFAPGDFRENHNSVQLEWTVNTPDGTTIARGRDFLLLNPEGQIEKLYMFNG
ncbi:nuclear transport factor 2 family protein [Micromonospora sp. NBC_01655]|uniref:nuclear transport factor 2 family protein n=1 Tax=Micromonospora sp. NBC_01655 TaxID=2975983 RepID=UPI00225A421D|nr:nuclear transport factor 2 family protein [Micromonospora sp. NBC_01655]MCX4471340.1 nuclear transport factor 2 family protein [Micromonospora sp. NBC_01655]